MSSKKVITDPCDFVHRSLHDPSGEPLNIFPSGWKHRNHSLDSGDIRFPEHGRDNCKNKAFALRLGQKPGKDGQNVIDLWQSGDTTSPYNNEKNMKSVIGTKYMLTSTQNNGSATPKGDEYSTDPSAGRCLHFNSRATINESYKRIGGGVGARYGNMELTEARWICPIGCMFDWSDLCSGGGNMQLKLDKFYLLFQEKDFYVCQYVPLITDFKWQDDQGLNYYSGKSINHTRNGGDRSEGNHVRCFMAKKDIEYLRTHRCALIGFQMRFDGQDSAGTTRDKALDFYKWKWLFQERSMPNSAAIYPEKTTMYDYLESEVFHIA